MSEVLQAERVRDAAEAIARRGFLVTFTPELGGADAAWDFLRKAVGAGRDASVRRANDHDPEAWTLEVQPWLLTPASDPE